MWLLFFIGTNIILLSLLSADWHVVVVLHHPHHRQHHQCHDYDLPVDRHVVVVLHHQHDHQHLHPHHRRLVEEGGAGEEKGKRKHTSSTDDCHGEITSYKSVSGATLTFLRRSTMVRRSTLWRRRWKGGGVRGGWMLNIFFLQFYCFFFFFKVKAQIFFTILL